MFALMLPLVVGAAALGVETTYWYQQRLRLQEEADAAAFAAVFDKKANRASSVIIASATKAATDNGFLADSGTITVNSPPTSGSSGANAVEVILTSTSPRFFTGLFTSTPVNLRARAVAKYSGNGSACVLALNASASGAAHFQGSASLNLNGCSVMANSTSSSAVSVQGAASLTTQCVISSGGVSLTNRVTQTCGSAVTNASPAADPFASVPEPTDASACKTVTGTSLTPGNYCSGFTVGNDITLAPGVYIISGAFKLNGNNSLTGTGVTLFFKAGSSISMNGNSTINISAPTTGPYAGMVMMGERSAAISAKINGNNSSHITGNIYFKSGDIDYQGSYSGVGGCTQLVADTVNWTGNAGFSVDCSAYGMSPIPAGAGATVLSE